LSSFLAFLKFSQLALGVLEMHRTNGAERLLAGAVEFVLPKGNVLLEFFDFLCFIHNFFGIVGGTTSRQGA